MSGALVQAGSVGRDVNIAMSVPARRVPRQVPALPAGFVNRTADFAALGEARGIALLTGLPGVGKSWFAREYAERHRARYSGGDLYVNFADTPEATGDVLAGFLRAYGVGPEVIPARLADQANLFRTHTADRPVLVVLDEVTDPAQVLPLLPKAPGSTVLVTSNNQLSELLLDGARPVPLEPLDADTGAHLLAELVGRRTAAEPEATAELVRQCAGLPVAFQVVAARLHARPRLRIAQLVAEIADEARGLRAFTLRGESRVSAVFSVAYQALPEPVARMYRVAGALPSPDFAVELAAAAAGLEPDAAGELLAELLEVSLLTEDADGRLHLHSLVRRHAREVSAEVDADGERIAWLRRAADYLRVTAAFADRTVLGSGRLRCTPAELTDDDSRNPFANDVSALDWLDAERPTVLAVIRIAIEQGWFDLAWQLAESMTALFVVRRYLVDWTEFTKDGVRAAASDGNPAAEARLRSFVSRAWTELGELPRARAELDQAVELAEQLDNPRLRASIWELFGRYHDAAHEYTEAVIAYEKAIELFRAEEDFRGVAFTRYFLGKSLLEQGNSGAALETLRQAQREIHELPGAQQRMEGRAWTSIARAIGAGQPARDAARQAIGLLGDHPFYAAQAQELLAELAEDPAEAAASLRSAIDLYTTIGSPRAEELRASHDRH